MQTFRCMLDSQVVTRVISRATLRLATIAIQVVMVLNKYQSIATTRFGCGEVGICHPSHRFPNCGSNNSPIKTLNVSVRTFKICQDVCKNHSIVMSTIPYPSCLTLGGGLLVPYHGKNLGVGRKRQRQPRGRPSRRH